MLSFALSFWLPGAVGATGLMRYVLWLFLLETKIYPKNGVLGFRLRLFGIGVQIEAFWPVSGENAENTTEIHVSARAIAPDGDERPINLTPDAQEWVASMAAHGIKMLIGKREMYVDADDSFVLPESLAEIEIDIGDRIIFGDPSDHVLVRVTGSRVQEDNSRVFYARKLAM
jgi:hypothetical protein